MLRAPGDAVNDLAEAAAAAAVVVAHWFELHEKDGERQEDSRNFPTTVVHASQ